MSQIKRIGIDTSKAVFTLHGVDQAGQPVLRTNLRRAQMIPFFKNLPPTEIAMEACASSHHWARLLAALGHTVRLLPPQYVKPFVKSGKNDRNDAEAICEAAGRTKAGLMRTKRPFGYFGPSQDPDTREHSCNSLCTNASLWKTQRKRGRTVKQSLKFHFAWPVLLDHSRRRTSPYCSGSY